jgi:Protein of unknown function (DUF3047)
MNIVLSQVERSGKSVTSRIWSRVWALLLPLAFPAMAQASIVWVGPFDVSPHLWQEVRLRKDVAPNRFERRNWDGVSALEVLSVASMSLMAHPLTVDLQATPVLCWRWRIARVIPTANMKLRQGDDYAARVYVSFKLPESVMGLGLRTKLGLARAIWGADLPDAAMNYVWDNRHPVGTEGPNAYTDRAIMVVQRSGDHASGAWVNERRNVLEDVSRLFSDEARAVQLAITADTDNTGQTAHAGFADFHFVHPGRACQFPPLRP